MKWQSSENTQTEPKKKREFLKNKDSFQDFWNDIKNINIHIIESQKESKRNCEEHI